MEEQHHNSDTIDDGPLPSEDEVAQFYLSLPMAARRRLWFLVLTKTTFGQVGIVVIALICSLAGVTGWWISGGRISIIILVGCIMLVVCVSGVVFLCVSAAWSLIRLFLWSLPEPFRCDPCLNCGYSHKGLPKSRTSCVECGCPMNCPLPDGAGPQLNAEDARKVLERRFIQAMFGGIILPYLVVMRVMSFGFDLSELRGVDLLILCIVGHFTVSYIIRRARTTK